MAVPPIHRLYDFAMSQSQRATAALQELATLSEERDALELQLYVLRSDHQRLVARVDADREEIANLSAKLAQAEAARGGTQHDCAAVELELYVLRSDHQRLIARMDAARDEIRDLHSALTAAEEKASADAPKAARADLELLSARITGRMTRGFGELEEQLRLLRGVNGTSVPADERSRLYLDLLEKTLIGQLTRDEPMSPWSQGFDPEVRALGRDWPRHAQTMIGAARMRNIRVLAERVLDAGTPGDFLEAGVWRGGACIYMRGILAAHGERGRTVWVADSFAGLPPPDAAAYPADAGDPHHTFRELVVPLDEVRGNFEAYGLLDDQVRFLPGWFADTLPAAPIERLAILRLDGDMYSSTIQTLDALYRKVSPGGFVIIDDYILEGCRKAVHDFRDSHGITEAIEDIDGAGVFWRKAA